MEVDSLFEDFEDNEEYDDFLFQSITRYKTLQMFNLENSPHHILPLDETSLCVASNRAKKNGSELLKLKLPTKLTLPPEEEGRCKEKDFKVLSGLYTNNVVHDIDKVDGGVITSEVNTTGLQVYSFPHTSLENKNEGKKIDFISWTAPNFAVIQQSTFAICSKCCHEPLILVDLTTGRKAKDVKHPFYTLNIIPKEWSNSSDPCPVNNIKCKPLSPDVIAVLSTHSGDVVMHDLRTNDCFTSLPGCNDKSSKEIWTLSGFDYDESDANYFGVLSNRKRFCVYDKRTNSILVSNTEENAPSETFTSMKFKFNNACDRFSISGLGSTVEIFGYNCDKFESIFIHNGHCPSGSSSRVVTDHVWLQAGGNEYIVSVCDNGSLNCWDYNV